MFGLIETDSLIKGTPFYTVINILTKGFAMESLIIRFKFYLLK